MVMYALMFKGHEAFISKVIKSNLSTAAKVGIGLGVAGGLAVAGAAGGAVALANLLAGYPTFEKEWMNPIGARGNNLIYNHARGTVGAAYDLTPNTLGQAMGFG